LLKNGVCMILFQKVNFVGRWLLRGASQWSIQDGIIHLELQHVTADSDKRILPDVDLLCRTLQCHSFLFPSIWGELRQEQFLFKVILIFRQAYDFWPKCRFVEKFSIFRQNFGFWPKFWLFRQNYDVLPKYRFLTKISSFAQNYYFWGIFRFLTKNFAYLTKITTFGQSFDFWPKLLVLCNISIRH